ncbi:MAG: hypothetical protein IKD79_02715, partial [Oscillospiraceae bacterium]|nr:hypothetical protein [Oscillospiraceae bacterium]
ESAGYATGVYTYIPVVYKEYILNDMEGLTFWLGDPGNWPEFYYEHAYWQYSFTGTVPGIDADVDLDVMYLPAGTAAPVHVPSPTPEPEAASGPADVTEPAEVPAEPASETEAGG